MSVADVFIDLFSDAQAKAEIRAYHTHTPLKTFSLATTSLRHIPKWYDRLNDIAKGIKGAHGNYYSDPQSLGLVDRAPTPGLTPAGKEFLNSMKLFYSDLARAEYSLNKILYYGPNSPLATSPLLKLRRQNMRAFLRKCRLTPNARTVLDDGRLLTMAELISYFGTALENFLLLSVSELQAFSKLGEEGFGTLLNGKPVNHGYITLAWKIGGEYTRASERRRNYLLSHLFLSIRNDLISRNLIYSVLVIPYPFSNLISTQVANDEVANYTDDIMIEPSGGSYLVFLNEVAASIPLPSPPSIQSLQLSMQRGHRHRGRTTTSVQRPTGAQSSYFVDAPLAIEAEDYIERMLHIKYGAGVRRIGHTTAESVPLQDGFLPGADIVIEDAAGSILRCIEVKSARAHFPAVIRLTASEYARAIKCKSDNIPFDLYVVVFGEIPQAPSVSLFANFHASISTLAIADLMGMEIGISKI